MFVKDFRDTEPPSLSIYLLEESPFFLFSCLTGEMCIDNIFQFHKAKMASPVLGTLAVLEYLMS